VTLSMAVGYKNMLENIQANNFLEPSAVNAMSSATRSTSQVGVGSLHGR
jgi:hypothetical protein